MQRGWIRKAIGATVVAAAIGIGAVGVADHNSTPPPAGTDTANVWVDTNGGTCTRQSTAQTYVDAAACSTMNAAIATAGAQRGDTVRMKAGTYAEQKLTAVPSGSSGYVVFRPADGETVTLGDGGAWGTTVADCGGSTGTFRQFCIEGSDWVEIRDMHGYRNAQPETSGSNMQVVNTSSTMGTEHVIFRNLDAVQTRVYGKVDDIQYIGGQIGGSHDTDPHNIISYGNTTADMPDHVTFDGVRFYDIVGVGDPNAHMECILANAFTNLTLVNSIFENCGNNSVSTADIHFNNDLGASSGLVVKGNFFNSDTTNEVLINKDLGGTVDIEHNSVNGQLALSDTYASGTYIVKGNYASSIDCFSGAGVTFSYNITTGGTCGGTDSTVGSLAFIDPATYNLHLSGSAGSPPKAFVATCGMTTDIDAESRPGTNCDAGADEVP